LTTQFYFPDEARNRTDGIYRPELEMQVQDRGGGNLASFNFVMNCGLARTPRRVWRSDDGSLRNTPHGQHRHRRRVSGNIRRAGTRGGEHQGVTLEHDHEGVDLRTGVDDVPR
jgi:hypothetical protein